MRILIVEDEPGLNRVLTKHLKNHGYAVDSCFDGQEGADYLRMTGYDLAILDIMLPGQSGLDILKEARALGNDVPILLLTARDAVEDKVIGLDAGADDYLTKPFALEELMARIRMLLRKKTGARTNLYRLADLTVDTGTKRVVRDGQEIILSPKEYGLLECLIMHKGQVLSREQIENHLWDYSYEGASNMVDVYIRYLRKKIDEGFSSRLIHTVRGAGYVMRETGQ